jgi:hypothetical protein
LRKKITMTKTSTPPALAVAQVFHQAWTSSKNLDQAMTCIADDITADAPGAHITGAQQYRGFLGQFMTMLTGIENIAAFGDDTTAMLLYYPHTAQVSDSPIAEYFTVADGKITRILLVLDGPSFAPPQG